MPIAGGRSIFEYFFLVHLYDTGSAVVNGQHAFRALGGISQSWTLVVEVSFYIFLPFYAALLRQLGHGPRPRVAVPASSSSMLGVLYAISVAWRAVVYWGAPKGSARRVPRQLLAAGQPRRVRARHGARGRARVGRRPRRRGRRSSRRSAASTGCGGCSPRSCFQAVSFWIGLPDRRSCSCRRQGVREGAPLQPHRVLPDPARGVRRAAHGRHAPVPAAAADGVPRHDLLRHLPLAPGLHREGAPVGRLVDNALPNGPFLEHADPGARARRSSSRR